MQTIWQWVKTYWLATLGKMSNHFCWGFIGVLTALDGTRASLSAFVPGQWLQINALLAGGFFVLAVVALILALRLASKPVHKGLLFFFKTNTLVVVVVVAVVVVLVANFVAGRLGVNCVFCLFFRQIRFFGWCLAWMMHCFACKQTCSSVDDAHCNRGGVSGGGVGGGVGGWAIFVRCWLQTDRMFFGIDVRCNKLQPKMMFFGGCSLLIANRQDVLRYRCAL